MNTATGLSVRVYRVWCHACLWVGGVSCLVLLSGCAPAHVQRSAAVNGVAEGAPSGPEDILQRGESYYHYLLSYAYQLRNTTE
jgi:hypothetical protein